MTEPIKKNQLDFSESAPILLTSRQIDVIKILSSAKYKEQSLADWYLGAIYAAKNKYNPDRFSQAAQSLRELLEKLPRVFVKSDIPEMRRPDFPGMRRNLNSQMRSSRKRYEGTWKDKAIDSDLEKTIQGVIKYFELNQMPTRKDSIHKVMSKLDPMHNILDQEIRSEKTERFQAVWKFFEALVHHNTSTDNESFWRNFSLVDRIIIDLLAPITAQDQGTIREILEKPQPEQEDIEKLLKLIKRRGANYAYFFNTADSPIWINPLLENDFFKNPPNVEVLEDGQLVIR